MKILNPNKRLVFWNKLGSVSEVSQSLIGLDGTQSGGSFTACKFGNGYYQASDTESSYIDFPITMGDAGCLEFWFKPNFNWNSTPVSAVFFWFLPNDDVRTFHLSYSSNYNNFFNYINTPSGTKYIIWDTPDGFSAGDLLHIALVWDKNGIDGSSNTQRFYFNGASCAVSVAESGFGQDAAIDPGAYTHFYWGRRDVLNQSYDGSGDNLKIWNYAKTDFTDKDIEYPIKAGIEFGKSNIYVNPEKRLILWNQLGNANEVAKSRIGMNGSLSGTYSFDTGKFGNGFKVTNYTDNGMITLPEILYNKGCIEFWWYPLFNYNDVVAAVPYQIYFEFDTGKYIILLYNQQSGQQEFRYYHYDGVSASTDVRYEPIFTANNWYHVAIVWDSSGINGSGDYRRFYFNGNRETRTGGDLETDNIDSTDRIADLYINNNSTGIRGGKGIIDNIKYHNYAKIDFSNKEIEYPIKANGTKIYNKSLEQLILWNQLGSVNEIAKSKVGVNGSISGTLIYSSCKFGNGIDTSVAGSYALFPIYFNHTKGCIEFWYKPTHELGTTTLNLFGIRNLSTSTNLFNLSIVASTSTFFMWVPTNDSSSSWIKFDFPAGTYINTNTHVAIVWDSIGSERLRVYINSSKLTVNSTNNWNNSTGTLGGSDYENLTVGARESSSDISDGPIDNIKLWNYVKTDFSDRELEYPFRLNNLITI